MNGFIHSFTHSNIVSYKGLIFKYFQHFGSTERIKIYPEKYAVKIVRDSGTKRTYKVELWNPSGTKVAEAVLGPEGAQTSQFIGLTLSMEYRVVVSLYVEETNTVGTTATTTVTPGIIYCDPNSPVDGGGNTWNEPRNDLQSALDAASANASSGVMEVRLCQGTFSPKINAQNPADTQVLNRSFEIKSNTKLVGGFNKATNIATDKTTLTGIMADGVARRMFYINGESNFEMESIIIRDCLNPGILSDGHGSGVFINEISNSQVRFTNCDLINNVSADTSAGGAFRIECGQNCTFYFTDCLFENNDIRGGSYSTYSFGGAIYGNCRYPNTAKFIMEDCVFSGNKVSTASTCGAGIYAERTSLDLNRCLFINNKASTAGAIYFAYAPTANDKLRMANSVFYNNGYSTGSNLHIYNTGSYSAIEAILCDFIFDDDNDTAGKLITLETVTLRSFFIGCYFYKKGSGSFVTDFSDANQYINCAANSNFNDTTFPGAVWLDSYMSPTFARDVGALKDQSILTWRTAEDKLAMHISATYGKGIFVKDSRQYGQSPYTLLVDFTLPRYLYDITGRLRFRNNNGTAGDPPTSSGDIGAYEYYPY